MHFTDMLRPAVSKTHTMRNGVLNLRMCVSAGVTRGPVITHILSLTVTTTPKHITPWEMRQFQKTGIQVGLVYALKIKHAIHVKGELHLDMSASTLLALFATKILHIGNRPKTWLPVTWKCSYKMMTFFSAIVKTHQHILRLCFLLV